MLLLAPLAFAEPAYGPQPPPDAESTPAEVAPVRADLVPLLCEPAPRPPAATEPRGVTTAGRVLTETLCVAAFFAGRQCGPHAPIRAVERERRSPCGDGSGSTPHPEG